LVELKRHKRGSGCGWFAAYLLLMWGIPTGIVFGCFRHFLQWPVAQSLIIAAASWFFFVEAFATVVALVIWCREKAIARRKRKADD
jgi:hypothetical protein